MIFVHPKSLQNAYSTNLNQWTHWMTFVHPKSSHASTVLSVLHDHLCKILIAAPPGIVFSLIGSPGPRVATWHFQYRLTLLMILLSLIFKYWGSSVTHHRKTFKFFIILDDFFSIVLYNSNHQLCCSIQQLHCRVEHFHCSHRCNETAFFEGRRLQSLAESNMLLRTLFIWDFRFFW